MAENKTQATGAGVGAFLAGIEDGARRADAEALAGLMERATGCPATMWGPAIVGFDRYHYRYESGREGEMLLVGFSPRKAGLVLYGLLGWEGAQALLGRLGKHTTGKGCLNLKKLADVDVAVLEELVREAVAAKRARV